MTVRSCIRPVVSALAMCIVLLSSSTKLFAWGFMGHEVASDLAQTYLTPNAAAQVRFLLPDETLAEASTWADRMRSDPSPFWQKEAGPYHYVTVPTGKSYADTNVPNSGDALTALSRFSRELRDTTLPRKERQRALRFGVHIVQDLQQPLHVGNGRDRGGNQIKVLVDGESETFHWLWDSLMFESQNLSVSDWHSRIKGNALLRTPSAADADPLFWVADSGELRDRIYPAPGSLSTEYLNNWLPIAEDRIALAAVRTAAWLNWVFADR